MWCQSHFCLRLGLMVQFNLSTKRKKGQTSILKFCRPSIRCALGSFVLSFLLFNRFWKQNKFEKWKSINNETYFVLMKMAWSVNHHNFKMTTKKGAIISKQSHFFPMSQTFCLDISGEAWSFYDCESESMIKHKMLPNMSQWRNEFGNELKFWSKLMQAFTFIVWAIGIRGDKLVWGVAIHLALFKVFSAKFRGQYQYCACCFHCWWSKLAFIVVSLNAFVCSRIA